MTSSEFISELEKTERFFGKTLTDEQKSIWFENLKRMDVKRFKYILSECYRRSEFFPALSKILEIDDELGHILRKEELREIVDCDICLGRGFVLYYKKKDGQTYQYVAKCSCKNAEEYLAFPSLSQVGLDEQELLKRRQAQKEKLEKRKIDRG